MFSKTYYLFTTNPLHLHCLCYVLKLVECFSRYSLANPFLFFSLPNIIMDIWPIQTTKVLSYTFSMQCFLNIVYKPDILTVISVVPTDIIMTNTKRMTRMIYSLFFCFISLSMNLFKRLVLSPVSTDDSELFQMSGGNILFSSTCSPITISECKTKHEFRFESCKKSWTVCDKFVFSQCHFKGTLTLITLFKVFKKHKWQNDTLYCEKYFATI